MTSIVPLNGYIAMSKTNKENPNEKKTLTKIEDKIQKLKSIQQSDNKKPKIKNIFIENEFDFIDEEDLSTKASLKSNYKKIISSSNINKFNSKFKSNSNAINLSSTKASDIIPTIATATKTTVISQEVSNHLQTPQKESIKDSNTSQEQKTTLTTATTKIKDDGMSSTRINDIADNKQQQQLQQKQQQKQQYNQRCTKGGFSGAVDITKDYLNCVIRNPIKNQLSQIHCNNSCVDDHNTSCCQLNKAAKINDSVASSSSSSSSVKQTGIDHFDECGLTSSGRIKRCSQQTNCCYCTKQYSPHNHHHHNNNKNPTTLSGINKCSKENDLEKNLQSSNHKDDQQQQQECLLKEGTRSRIPTISASPLMQPTHSATSYTTELASQQQQQQQQQQERQKVSEIFVAPHRQEKNITDEKQEYNNIEKNISICPVEKNQQQLLENSSETATTNTTGGVKSQFDNNNSISMKIMCGCDSDNDNSTMTTTTTTTTTTATTTKATKIIDTNSNSKLKNIVNCDKPPSQIDDGGNGNKIVILKNKYIKNFSDKNNGNKNIVNKLKNQNNQNNNNKNNDEINLITSTTSITSAICKTKQIPENEISSIISNDTDNEQQCCKIETETSSSSKLRTVAPCNDNLIGKSDLSLEDNIDDEEDDPYYELQEYLERVKREINEVFEQYKLKNDESPTCTSVDSNTINNKLFVQKTPCFLNGKNSEKKLFEISSNNSNSNSNKESERSVSSTTIIATSPINVSSNCDAVTTDDPPVSKIIPNAIDVTSSTSSSSSSSSSITTISSSPSSMLNATTMTRSSKMTECNSSCKEHVLELQPEDNQLQPQQPRIQNDIAIENVKRSNGMEIVTVVDTDDIDAASACAVSIADTSSVSSDGIRMRLDIQNTKDTNDVKIWENTILKELDNLMGSDKRSVSIKSEKDRNIVNVNNENYNNWTHSNILKPEKHTTIPLQSFNLDHSLKESLNPYHDCKKDIMDNTKKSLIYANNFNMNNNNNNSTSINNNNCKDQICDKNQHQKYFKDNNNVTILKIEEDTTGGKTATITTTTTIPLKENGKIQSPQLQSSSSSSSILATNTIVGQTKKEIQQQASFLQNQNDTIKKGSTSTIWTSEESILRSVGAVDEDNKSTSSSACDEASALLSSVKSDNSSVSSGIDNENNESGIGTATPPKDISDSCRGILLKNTILKDNNVIMNDYYQNQYTIFDKLPPKYQKCNSIISSSDDTDLLEILSQFEGINEDDEILSNQNYDFDCGSGSCGGDDSENSMTTSATLTTTTTRTSPLNYDNVILRNKDSLNSLEHNHKIGVSLPINRIRKGRSHSIETVPFTNNISGFNELLFNDTYDKTSQRKHLFCLPIQQEPFQNSISCNIRELPSPSSASLHSGNGTLVLQELTIKSNSAPILLKKDKHKDGFGTQQSSLRYSRSQSDRYLAEIEAIEACKWLRAAGFPQYAQMYEDLQFPIDLSNVAKDHPMLENDPLQSLYRRLCILNRCATMRLDNTHKQHGQQKDESDDEGFTLSENWTFQPQSRRWSRVGETGLEIQTKRLQQQQQQQQQQQADKTDGSSKDSSPERFDDDSIHDGSEDQNFSSFVLRSETPQPDSGGGGNIDQATVRLRRTGSERLKDGAKALLRRVESIKSRRRKRQNREGLVISGPQMLNLPHFNQRMSEMKCIDVTAFSNPPSPSPTSPVNIFPRTPIMGNELKVPTEYDKAFNINLLSPKRSATSPRHVHSTRTSPLHFFTATMPHLREGKSDDSSSYYSDSQESTGGGRVVSSKKLPTRSRRFLQRSGKVDDIGAHSDSECHHQGRKMLFKDGSTSSEVKVKKLTRGGSLNFGKESKRYREQFQSRSFRSRTGVRKGQKGSESDREDGKIRSQVFRWHSFRSDESPQLLFKKCSTSKTSSETQIEGTKFSSMSCGQLQIIRKLALVTLTGYMERYCPTHRTGWNWELPKFIKKIKTPDYKDKKVFGVPLLLILQRTGHSLPAPIRGALKWLHINALDQIGLFRKSGVKSRISKLKERIESSDTDCMEIYDSQQAYDVADMLKQYFRDLPDCLLTTKMSETFVAIFQHLPCEVRADAIQSAVLLLPDEHREVLYSLLQFLNEVADNSQYNQMTANNLSVCLAPSLFHNNISSGNRSTSSSPRRRKATGVPDVKELSETKASHECLTFMIMNFKKIFTASRDKILRCNFGYMEESRPVPLEALGEGMPFHNWRGYLYECTSATIKEGREKSRGWISITSLDPNVEIAYKKVGDGHPLRLWRCITEIEAPPHEVLTYILKERNSWDVDLLKCRTVQKLDDHSEVFQYACDGHIITDYCVLRSWQPDLPRKACVIVETSIDHPDATLLLGGVRGVVLASRYLIEPCGSGKSRLMHLSRVDTKGKTPEWYNKCYGHICSHYLSNIRSAFRQITDGGPESKV